MTYQLYVRDCYSGVLLYFLKEKILVEMLIAHPALDLEALITIEKGWRGKFPTLADLICPLTLQKR